MARGDRGAEYGKRRAERQAARDIAGHIESWCEEHPRDDERWESCRDDFGLFCKTYHPGRYELPWSDDHLRAIAKIEMVVSGGGQYALAMPRGHGKTTLCETAAEWAILYGHRQFVVFVGSTDKRATQCLESIRLEMVTNDALAHDFPGVICPLRALDNIAQRAGQQTWGGRLTHVSYTNDEVVLPFGPDDFQGHEGYGGIILAVGLTGSIRGHKRPRPDGVTVRPDLVILDDPQTDASAKSVTQNHDREALVAGAVLGMAGPKKKIAAIMPCTVIKPGDMADSLLDTEKHPDWNGERSKLVYQWPHEEKLWDEYGEIWAKSLRAHGDIRDATEFYREHREQMDAGGVVSWPERYNSDELSAIQNAWNLRLGNYPVFMAEYQNDPLPDDDPSDYDLDADAIMQKVNGLARGAPHGSAGCLTGFIDIQGNSLWWVVAAWAPDFTGWVVDYGVYPDQRGRAYYSLRDLRYTLDREFPKAGLEGQIYGGLEKLVPILARKQWKTPAGAVLKLDRLLIDQNWAQSTDVVYDYCMASRHSNLLLPSRGHYVGPRSKPIDQWNLKRGERGGPGWRISPPSRRVSRFVTIDVNLWKSFVAERLLTPMGDPGCLSLFGKEPSAHRCLADQCTAEACKVEGDEKGRKVGVWKLLPNRDNHWWDGLVGAACAASIEGCKIEAEKQAQGKHGQKRSLQSALKRRRPSGKSFSAMYRERKNKR